MNLYAFLQLHYGIAVQMREQYMGLQPGMTADVALLLKTDVHAPVWYWCRLGETVDGGPIEWRRRFVVADNILLQTSGPAAAVS